MMTKEDYEMAHTHVVIAFQLLRDHPFGKLLEAQQTAHAIGPILDPTLYIKKMSDMRFDRRMFEIANRFVSDMKTLIGKELEKK
jgi:hypothetical protein